jgi:putative flippase GtrA
MVAENVSQRSFQRFLVVGVSSTCVNYGVYLLIYLVVRMDYDLAFIIGFLSGVACGYLLNRAWTFQIRSGGHKRYVWRYLIVYITSLLIGLAVVRWSVKWLGLDPIIANLCPILVTTFINYVGIRHWVFCR